MSVDGGPVATVPALAPQEHHTVAPHLPDLLLGLFERRYLIDFDASRWALPAWPDDAGRPLLAEVEAIGSTPAPEEWAAAMPHVLTACHARGHAVVMIVHGDGQRHRILIGGRRIPGATEGSTEDYLEGQASALRGHVPGLVLGPALRLGEGGPDDGGHADVARQIREAPSFAVLTGVPSTRGEGPAAALFQSIEQLVAATGTHRYTLTVVAEPLPEQVLDAAIDECRRLRGEVHGLIQRTIGSSTSDSTDVTENVTAPPDLTELLPLLAFAGFTGLLPGGHVIGGAMLGFVDRTSTGSRVGHSRTDNTSTVLLDAVAEACDQHLQQQILRLQRARSHGWWRAAVYVAADSDAALHAVTGAVRSITSGEWTAVDPVRVVRPPAWHVRSAMLRGQILRMLPADGGPAHPLGDAYDALATCVSSTELAILVNLPRRNVPGLLIREIGEFALSAPEPAAKSIELGRVLDGQQRVLAPLTLTADALNRHVFIGGMTGYGKTTTAMNLLVQARARLDVPFLVIEPVKSEYRALQRVRDLPGHISVYTVGEEPERDRRTGTTALPLRLNPFEPVGQVSLSRHIDLLKAVFNASFPMGAGMSYILEEAMLLVYEDYGWNLDTSRNDVLGRHPRREDRSALVPTIADVCAKVDAVLAGRKYAGEVHQNLGAALRSRLRSLTVGTKGMTLDTRRSVPVEDLFDRPAVIELLNLGDDEEKAFVMALLLCRLYEYAEARHQERPRPGLRHLTLIEEAHRLLRSPSPFGTSAESADPQAKAVTMFTDLLAEMRAYGEGFVVADQVPTKLTPDVLKNSNIKILHRLVAPDDRAAAGGTINLTEPQSRHLAGLSQGIAVVHDDRLSAATLVRMHGLDLTPAGGPVAARPQDRGYLLRSSACRHCPAPCELLSPNRRHRDAHTVTADIGRVLDAVATGRPADAWSAWKAWRARWVDGAGDPGDASVYCAATQAATSLLEAAAGQRAEAAGLAAAPAAARAGLHRLGRTVAGFVQAWRAAIDLDDAALAAADRLRQDIAEETGTRPPLEMVGCRDCPVRCRVLPQVAGMTRADPKLLTDVVDKATTAVSVESRLRSTATRVRGKGDADARRDLERSYCLLTLAAHRRNAEVTDVLDRCREELVANG